MLAELHEREATGEIAAIYEEIRRLSAVPYVSSMQRHLATRPGWLEWVWAAVRPAFVSGRAQAAAWRAAEHVDVPRLAPIPREALRVWGVDADAEARAHAACSSFVRVAPINLVLSGLLRRLLRGERPPGPGDMRAVFAPPPSLGGLPPLVDVPALPPAERAVLASLGTTVDGELFVPGLYRMLARWPAFLAHVATVLRPRLDDPETSAACLRVRDAVDAEVPAVFEALPELPARPPIPSAAAFPAVLAALDTYRKTSPEMVVVGVMIRTAFPALDSPAAAH
jgi:hypothetical protein